MFGPSHFTSTMIAILRKAATRDSILTFVAATTIALWAFADQPPRQLLTWRDSSERVHHYSMELGDPRIRDINERIGQWNGDWPTAKVASLRWRKEMAELYASQLPSLDRKVIPASYIESDQDVLVGPETQEYWRAVGIQTDQILQSREQLLELRSMHSIAPPLELGRVVPGQDDSRSIGWSITFGLAVTLIFAIWSLFSPPRSLDRGFEPGEASDPDGAEFRLEIPAAWVRLRQPTAVRLRQLAFFGLTAGALVICQLEIVKLI